MIGTVKGIRKDSRLLLLPALLLLLTAFLLSAVLDTESKAAALELENGAQLATEYVVGNTLEIPKAKILSGSQELSARHTLRFPSGRTSVGSIVKLSEAGIYSLEYSAVSGGKVLTKNISLTAKLQLFGITGGRGGSARLGYYGDEDSDYIDGTTDGGTLRYPDAGMFGGIRLNLPENAVFNYNRAIDISKLTGDDVLFDFIALPDNKGTADLYELQIVFTDAYDAENKLSVKLQQRMPSSEAWTTMLTFVQAKGKNQQFTGLENDVVQVGGESGASGYFAFNGEGRQPVGKEFFRLSYDKEESRLYHLTSRGKVLICDFDDPRFVGLNPWSGFSGDEIFVSVSGRRFNNSPAKLLITNIFGQDLSAQAEEFVSVTNGPVLKVDTLGYSQDNLPVAVLNKPYTIFSYTAADAYGKNVRAQAEVYYGYGSSQQVRINVSSNSFTPKLPGLYVIKYTAVNAFGKPTEKNLYVNCVNSADISLELPIDYVTVATAGIRVPVKTPVYSGGSGVLSYAVSVSKDGNAIALKDNSFLPEEAGTYQVLYRVTDYLGQTAEKLYNVESSVSNIPVFTQSVVLPKYFLAGYEYDLPKVMTKNYSNGQEAYATVTATGGVITGDKFKSAEAGVASIIYASGATSQTTNIPVLDATKQYTDEYDGNTYTGIDSSKYFDLNNLTVYQTKDTTIFTPVTASDAGFTFINALYANGFSITFSVPGGKSDFDGLEITLTDYEDYSKTLVIGLRVLSNGSTGLYINGKATGNSLTNSLMSGKNIVLYYSADTSYITDQLGLSQRITDFAGFGSGKVYFSAELVGVKSLNAAISVTEINAQGINSLPYDSVRPQTKIIDKMPILVDKGQLVDIARAVGMDVLNPQVSGYITAQKVGGDYLTATDNTLLSPSAKAGYNKNYQVRFDDFGIYLITYISEDSQGNRASPLTFSLRVIDNESPVISVNEKSIPVGGTVGQSIVLPSATVTDNVDSGVKVAVLVIEPSTGHYYYLNEIQSGSSSYFRFTPVRKGYHTVRYFAADQSGNITTIDFIVGIGE